jgi:hypothetical protein
MFKYLNKTIWTRPDNYGGFNPEGDYVIAERTRNSDILTESNYHCIMRDLLDHAKRVQSDDHGPYVYDWRAGHWGCGWIEYLMISKDSPDELKAIADSILEEISNYPVYSEDDFSEREYEYAQSMWRSMTVKERAKLCKENGVCIFSARLDYIPPEDSGGIYDSCSCY